MTGEFWWLEPLGIPLQGEVRVGTSKWTPSTEDPVFKKVNDPVALNDLGLWAARHYWKNVHRSLELLPTPETRPAATGPFVIDIDVEQEPLEAGCIDLSAGLEGARRVAVAVVSHFRAAGVSASDMRVYFSGRRGFHVHVVFVARSDMHRGGFDEVERKWRAERHALLDLIGAVPKFIAVDVPHRFTRLRGSVNAWKEHGMPRRWRVTQLAEDELRDMPISEVVERAAGGAAC